MVVDGAPIYWWCMTSYAGPESTEGKGKKGPGRPARHEKYKSTPKAHQEGRSGPHKVTKAAPKETPRVELRWAATEKEGRLHHWAWDMGLASPDAG